MMRPSERSTVKVPFVETTNLAYKLMNNPLTHNDWHCAGERLARKSLDAAREKTQPAIIGITLFIFANKSKPVTVGLSYNLCNID